MNIAHDRIVTVIISIDIVHAMQRRISVISE